MWLKPYWLSIKVCLFVFHLFVPLSLSFDCHSPIFIPSLVSPLLPSIMTLTFPTAQGELSLDERWQNLSQLLNRKLGDLNFRQGSFCCCCSSLNGPALPTGTRNLAFLSLASEGGQKNFLNVQVSSKQTLSLYRSIHFCKFKFPGFRWN